MTQSSNRSLTSIIFQGATNSFAASLITLSLGLFRSIFLARNLLPREIGTVAFAALLIAFVSQLKGFGFDLALIHYRESDRAFNDTVVTVRLIVELILLAIFLATAPLFAWLYPFYDQLLPILLVMSGAYFVSGIAQIQEAFIRKSLSFGELAIIDVSAAIAMTVSAVAMIFMGYGIWALIIGEILVGFIVRCTLTWTIFRGWTPSFSLDRTTLGQLWNYGRPTWVMVNLIFVLDRFDDFWVGTFLGSTPLGIYSKTYEFAQYPRRILANPITKVFFPIFAQVQDQRQTLSELFFRVMFIATRIGVLGAGVLVLIIPELVHWILGEQWIPMINTFRIMIIYATLDPLLILCQDLLLAIGYPIDVRQARILQSLFFIPAVILGASLGGIIGVAIAADIMLLIGFISLVRSLKKVVDFSASLLFTLPTLFLTISLGLAFGIEQLTAIGPMAVFILKLVGFGGGYVLLTLIFERKELITGVQQLVQIAQRRPPVHEQTA